MRAECLALGLHLGDAGTRRLPWLDLYALLWHAPPHGPLKRALHPEVTQWDTDPVLHVVADVWDLLAAINTAKGRKPPVHRRGAADETTETIGVAHEWDEVEDFMKGR